MGGACWRSRQLSGSLDDLRVDGRLGGRKGEVVVRGIGKQPGIVDVVVHAVVEVEVAAEIHAEARCPNQIRRLGPGSLWTHLLNRLALHVVHPRVPGVV